LISEEKKEGKRGRLAFTRYASLRRGEISFDIKWISDDEVDVGVEKLKKKTIKKNCKTMLKCRKAKKIIERNLEMV